MKQDISVIKDIVTQLLAKMGFPLLEFKVKEIEEEIIDVQVNIDPQDSGLLIGFHGENIFALQFIIGQIFHQQVGRWKKITVDVGDYREKRKEMLKTIALNAAEKAKQTGQPISLPNLNGNERRIIHLLLSDDQEIKTYSQGEGKNRVLLVETA